MGESRSPRVRWAIILGVLCAVVLPVASRMILGRLAAHRRAATERAWTARWGPTESWLGSERPLEPTPAALEIERLGAALGISLSPRGTRGRARPNASRLAFAPVRDPVDGYVLAVVTGTAEETPAPPEGVRTFLRDHRGPLDALLAGSMTDAPIRWESDLEALPPRVHPNVDGHLALHSLILADALARAAAGEHAAAVATFEASWRLAGALHADPDLASQLGSLKLMRLQAGALRHLRAGWERWSGEFAARDPRASLTRALQLEGWRWLHLDNPIDTLSISLGRRYRPRLNSPVRLLARLAAPYLRLCTADLAGSWSEALARLSDVEALCDRDTGFLPAYEKRVGRWNAVGRNVRLDPAAAVRQLERLQLDRELTLEILRLRAERTRGLAPGSRRRASSACPGDEWVVEERDERVRIRFSRRPAWTSPGNEVALDLPLAFELARPAS